MHIRYPLSALAVSVFSVWTLSAPTLAEEIHEADFHNAAGSVVTTDKLTATEKFQNGGTLTVTGDVIGPEAGILNNTGTLSFGGNLTAGEKLQSGSGNGVVNTGTMNFTGKDQTVSTNSLFNGSAGKLYASGALTVRGGIQNSGVIAKSEGDSISELNGESLINEAKGRVHADSLWLTGALTNLGQVTSEKVNAKSIDNRAGATLQTDQVGSTAGNISNSGVMAVTRDVRSASGFTNAGSMTVGNLIQAVGPVVMKEDSELSMTENDARITTEGLVSNRGKLHAVSSLHVEGNQFVNYGLLGKDASDPLPVLTIAAQTVVNEAGGVMRMENWTSSGSVTNRGTVESTGVVTLDTLGNAKGATFSAASLRTVKANHSGHLSNSGEMKVTGEVEVKGHFGNLEGAVFEAGKLIVSNARDAGLSFKVDELDLLVSPQSDEGLGYFDFDSETVAEIGSVTAENGQLKLFGAGIEIGSLTKDSTVILQVDDLEPGKAQIGFNEGDVTVEVPSEVTDTFNPADLTTEMQRVADTVEIGAGEKRIALSAAEGTVLGELRAETDSDGRVINIRQEANLANVGISEMASVAMMTWRAETSDLFGRLNEVRNGAHANGLWVRTTAGEAEYGTQGVETDLTTVRFGYDHRTGVRNEWILGGAFTYTEGESTFEKGTGDNYQYGLALYGSWLGQSGEYVDVVGKYVRLKNSFRTDGGVGRGDYYGNGLSIGFEAGKRLEAPFGLYAEPQVAFTYGYLTDADYVTSADAYVRQDSMKTAVGRAGLRIGRSFAQGEVHAGVSYLKDWQGETSVMMRRGTQRVRYAQDLGDEWFELEVGGVWSLRDNLSLYGTFGRTGGAKIDMPWKADVGVRFVW